MGLFSNQFQSVIEWSDDSEGILLWKWQDTTIKKNSKLVIRPGQQAVFLYNGNVEGIFTEFQKRSDFADRLFMAGWYQTRSNRDPWE